MENRCRVCAGKKYIFLSRDGSPLGSASNIVAPCMECHDGLSLKEIEIQGGFKLIRSTDGWYEYSYSEFEEKLIAFINGKHRTKSQIAGIFVLRMQTFGDEYSSEKVNKMLVELKSYKYLEDVLTIAWGSLEGVREFNKMRNVEKMEDRDNGKVFV